MIQFCIAQLKTVLAKIGIAKIYDKESDASAFKGSDYAIISTTEKESTEYDGKVIKINEDGKTITYTNKTGNGMAKIAQNSLVMFHVSKHTDKDDMNFLGKFMLAKVLSDNGDVLVLDSSIKKVFDIKKIDIYECQLISVAQFNNLTINKSYGLTPKWDKNAKIGGICVIASKGICNIENGGILLDGRGGDLPYGREGLEFIGNAQMADILPLGQGNGSVFLLANVELAQPNKPEVTTEEAEWEMLLAATEVTHQIT